MTTAEIELWKYLRRDQIDGVRFRRQYGIGPYIADFYAPRYRLVIEVDGGVHDSQEAKGYDFERNQYMDSIGITTLRFSNERVLGDREKVLDEIHAWFRAFPLLTKKGELQGGS
jgi:very-short-patch-repair endonuclease